MAVSNWKRLLHATVVVLAVISVVAFGRKLRAEVCAPNNPCVCQNCCEVIQPIEFTCRSGQLCTFDACIGGAHNDIAANSECVSCCGGSNNQVSWYKVGSCMTPSPVKKTRSARLTQPQLLFVRGCDGAYSLVTLDATT